MSPRLSVSGNLSSTIEARAGALPRTRVPDSYRHELAQEVEKSSSSVEDDRSLPRWLQLAKLTDECGTKYTSSIDHLQANEQELMQKQNTEAELLQKWRHTCSRLHTNSEPKSAPRRLLSNQEEEQPSSPLGSPVKTDLVLGSSRESNSPLEKTRQDWTECTQDELSNHQRAKTAAISDVDALKRLFKGLVDKVSWQQEEASAIAVVVTQLKSESRKRAGGGARGDSWLLFTGPSKVGKWKMANALSELVFGTGPTTVCFGGAASRTGGDDGGQNVKSRGRTSMDRVVEAVRRNPFSMIVLENVDQADGLVRGRIKRAMEQGRLVDSYGREVSLGSVIFILSSSWLPKELKRTHDSLIQCEEKILQSAGHGWRLQLSAQRTPGTRCFDWLRDSDRSVKLRR